MVFDVLADLISVGNNEEIVDALTNDACDITLPESRGSFVTPYLFDSISNPRILGLDLVVVKKVNVCL